MLSLRPSVLIVMFGVQSVLTLNHLSEPENNLQDREYLVYQAKLAETAARYNDIAESMKQVAELKTDLSVEEIKTLALAYNHDIGHRRASLRKLTSMDNEADNNDTRKVEMLMNYRESIKNEISEKCLRALDIINWYLIPPPTSAESKVLIYTMKGDYNRYLAELGEGVGSELRAKRVVMAYTSAENIASEQLAPFNPIRLQFELNRVIYYETQNNRVLAMRLAKEAYDLAFSASVDFSEDSKLIMEILRDKLYPWLSDKTSEDS